MLTSERINAMKKINEELKKLLRSPLTNLGIVAGLSNEDNMFE